MVAVGGGGGEEGGGGQNLQDAWKAGNENEHRKRKWAWKTEMTIPSLSFQTCSESSYSNAVPVSPLREGEGKIKFRQQSCLIGLGKDTLLVCVYLSLCTVQTQLHQSY